MRVPKLQRTPNPTAPELSAFTQPPTYPTGGMRQFAPAKTLKYPLVSLLGTGIPTGTEIYADGAPILRVLETNFDAPVAGGGVIAGQLVHQPLVDPYDDGGAYVSPDSSTEAQ